MTECFPYVGNELRSMVGDNVVWDPMKADNMENKEVSSFRSCGELGESNKVNRLGEPVHNGEYGCVTMRGRKASNKVERDVGL